MTILLDWQASDAVKQLQFEFPGSQTEFACEWGNIFARFMSSAAAR